MFRTLCIAIVVALSSTAALAQTRVDGHIRKDGAYVPPHYRTNPDNSLQNNWSTRGNTNPYTGRQGTVDPYRSNNNFGTTNPYGSNGFYGSQRRY